MALGGSLGIAVLITVGWLSFPDPVPGQFTRTPADSARTDSIPAAVSGILQEAEGEIDLVILLAHASTAGARDMIPGIPEVDVAVRGHEPEDGPYLEMVHHVPLLLPEARSRNVVQAVLTLADDGSLASRRARTWELKQIENGDPRLDALVRDFEAKHGLGE